MTSSMSPVVQDNAPLSEQKKSFLTPCRRLGLARRSPMSGGGLHKDTASSKRLVDTSPVLKSPEPPSPASIPAAGASHFMKTPSRCGLSRAPSKNLYKRLKCSHSNQQQSFSSNQSTPGQSVTSAKEGCSEGKSQSERAEEPPDAENGEEEAEEEAAGSEDEHQVKDGKLNGQEITVEMIEEVKARIKEKEDRIRHLEQMKIYRKKHHPEVLKKLIERWRKGCQKAVHALVAELRERGHSLTIEELLKQLRIPFDLVKYNPDEEDFEQ